MVASAATRQFMLAGVPVVQVPGMQQRRAILCRWFVIAGVHPFFTAYARVTHHIACMFMK
jgi:hypothetical protein